MIGRAAMIGGAWRLRRPRAIVVGVSGSVLGALVCIALSASPALAAEQACEKSVASGPVREATEQHRQESAVDPVNRQPYSVGLPECRAYEMVSPVYKQSFGATPPQTEHLIIGFPAAPDGEAAGFVSEGLFAHAENYSGQAQVQNPYISRRGPEEWESSSTYPPAELKINPQFDLSDFALSSEDLGAVEGGCGSAYTLDVAITSALRCAIRKDGGPWEASALFSTAPFEADLPALLGASSNLSHIVFSVSTPPLGAQPGEQPGEAGVAEREAVLYEMSGPGTAQSEVRRINVGNGGNVLMYPGTPSTPLLGDSRLFGIQVRGTDYQAISESGKTVFFTAAKVVSVAKGEEPEHDVSVLDARISCETGPHCFYMDVEDSGRRVEAAEGKTAEGNPVTGQPVPESGRETVEISKPSEWKCKGFPTCSDEEKEAEWECTGTCAEASENPPADATFQGASADGTKVFFSTEQRLLNGDTNTTPELYEYNFKPKPGQPNLTLISAGQPGTEFAGVARTSSDGSHVYFLQKGLIPAARDPQNKNRTALPGGAEGEEAASPTAINLYGYDTETGETKFAATTLVENVRTAGGPRQAMEETPAAAEVSTDELRTVQTTPDGRYLVFSSRAALAGDTNANSANAVYLYSFQTGELTWVSRAAPECTGEGCGTGGLSAWIAPVTGTYWGAAPDVGDFDRAVSGCPAEAAREEITGCKQVGEHDGEYVIFTTREKLQNEYANGVADLYEWHNGEVHMISDAITGLAGGTTVPNTESPSERAATSMSASGSDIFFFTTTALVKQDTDVLGDLYDARLPRPDEPAGFPAPKAEASCSGEACQGSASEVPSFSLATSAQSAFGGNLLPPATQSLAFKTKAKPLTRAQKLAKALKSCKAKPKQKRRACESQARKKYGAKANKSSAKKTKAKKSSARKSDRRRG